METDFDGGTGDKGGAVETGGTVLNGSTGDGSGVDSSKTGICTGAADVWFVGFVLMSKPYRGLELGDSPVAITSHWFPR